MNLASAVANIRANRKAILFLGAGFSNGALNQVGEPTPSSNQLAKLILEYLNIPGQANLGLAIDKLREKKSPKDAYDFIANQLTIPKLTEQQRELLSLPWTRIYTTNVDNVGSTLSQRRWHDATQQNDPVSFGDFVYLHGCITNCTLSNYYSNLKLGEQLYLMNSRSGSGYYHMLKQDLHECDAVFVVGYSMSDPDFATTFFNSNDLINKCFVFSGVPDELSAHRISLIGTNTNLGMEQLALLVKNQPPNEELTFRSDIIVDSGDYTSKEITQSSRQNLLIFGRYDENVARTSWTTGNPQYVVQRKMAEFLASLSSPKIAIVHSHLGNGKSLIFSYARFLLTRNGGKVYSIKSEVTPEALLQALSEIPPNSHVFFEGDIFAVADTVPIVRNRSLILCTTSRTTTIRVATPALARAAEGIVQLFDANRLSRTELQNFHDLIDSMAFWPSELSQLSSSKRMEQLEKAFDSNVNAVVLKIFENKNVREEILTQWTGAQKELRPIMDHLVVASYMQLIDISVPAYILNEFQNLDQNILRALENDIVRVSHSGNIAFGNAIIGEFILRNHAKKNDVIGAIVRFANFIDGHPAQRSLQWIVRRLLRFWNLNRLLGSTKLPNEVLDRASYVPHVNADPLFWVQYSISQMENGEFLPADRFLSTAYARADDRGANFDRYQIDTHAARLSIRKIIATGMYDGASKDILDAVKKLRMVIQRRPDDTYHVASVVLLILKAEISWSYVLNDRDFSIFKNNLKTIGQVLGAIPPGEFLFSAEREALDIIRSLG
jgi:hypothetical protein